jgi:hypothetical protein
LTPLDVLGAPSRQRLHFNNIDIDFHFILDNIDIELLKKKGDLKGRAMKPWHEVLEEEDLQFIKRLVLASGSLKELAQGYGVSYPTIRLRLDRLIEKLKVLDRGEIQDEYERLLRASYAEGKLEKGTFQTLLAAYETAKQKPESGGTR